MFGVRRQLGVFNVMLLFLILSFILGLMLGAGPVALGVILAFTAFDFIFIPPYYSITIADRNHVLALFVYLSAALASNILISGIRHQAKEALRQSQRITLLYDLNRALIADATSAQVLNSIVKNVVEIYGSVGCRVVLAENDRRFTVVARWPQTLDSELDRQGEFIARWAMEHRSPAGLSNQGRRIRRPHGIRQQTGDILHRRQQDVLYVPISASERTVGALEIVGEPGGGRFNYEDERILNTFADQAALAMQRAWLTEEATRASALEQANELKSALLAAVSHDLRTPLTAIKASASTLLDTSIEWSSDVRVELLAAIDEETDRLTLMISNLLDLSRIEGGVLKPDRDWHDIAELIQDVVHRMSRQTVGRHIEIDLRPLCRSYFSTTLRSPRF